MDFIDIVRDIVFTDVSLFLSLYMVLDSYCSFVTPTRRGEDGLKENSFIDKIN